MKGEYEITKVVEKVLKNEQLHNFIEIFKKEHNPIRGTHERPLVKIKATIQDKEPKDPFPGLFWVDTS